MANTVKVDTAALNLKENVATFDVVDGKMILGAANANDFASKIDLSKFEGRIKSITTDENNGLIVELTTGKLKLKGGFMAEADGDSIRIGRAGEPSVIVPPSNVYIERSGDKYTLIGDDYHYVIGGYNNIQVDISLQSGRLALAEVKDPISVNSHIIQNSRGVDILSNGDDFTINAQSIGAGSKISGVEIRDGGTDSFSLKREKGSISITGDSVVRYNNIPVALGRSGVIYNSIGEKKTMRQPGSLTITENADGTKFSFKGVAYAEKIQGMADTAVIESNNAELLFTKGELKSANIPEGSRITIGKGGISESQSYATEVNPKTPITFVFGSDKLSGPDALAIKRDSIGELKFTTGRDILAAVTILTEPEHTWMIGNTLKGSYYQCVDNGCKLDASVIDGPTVASADGSSEARFTGKTTVNKPAPTLTPEGQLILEGYLREQGVPENTINKIIEDPTMRLASIKGMQTVYGVKADGIIGSRTFDATRLYVDIKLSDTQVQSAKNFNGKTENQPYAFEVSESLKSSGMSDMEVKDLLADPQKIAQMQLRVGVKPDGKVGPKTLEAVKEQAYPWGTTAAMLEDVGNKANDIGEKSNKYWSAHQWYQMASEVAPKSSKVYFESKSSEMLSLSQKTPDTDMNTDNYPNLKDDLLAQNNDQARQTNVPLIETLAKEMSGLTESGDADNTRISSPEVITEIHQYLLPPKDEAPSTPPSSSDISVFDYSDINCNTGKGCFDLAQSFKSNNDPNMYKAFMKAAATDTSYSYEGSLYGFQATKQYFYEGYTDEAKRFADETAKFCDTILQKNPKDQMAVNKIMILHYTGLIQYQNIKKLEQQNPGLANFNKPGLKK